MREAIPLASSDLALYEGKRSLTKAETLLSQLPAERTLFQQFKGWFEIIVMLTVGAEAKSIYEKLEPSLLSSRLYKALFQMNEKNAQVRQLTAKVQELEQQAATTTSKVLEKINRLISTVDNLPELSGTESGQRKIAATAGDDFDEAAEPDTIDQAWEWLGQLDQRVSRDLQKAVPVGEWVKKTTESSRQSKSYPGRQVLTGYYYFMAAITLLDARIFKNVIMLDRLKTTLPEAGLARVRDYLKKSRESGFPYAPLLQAITDAYALTPKEKKLETFDERADFFLAMNESIFEACWAGVEQAYRINNVYDFLPDGSPLGAGCWNNGSVFKTI